MINTNTKTIYIVTESQPSEEDNLYLGLALTEDGDLLATTTCVDLDTLHRELGVGTKNKHILYRTHYPFPIEYKLECVDYDNIMDNKGAFEALRKLLGKSVEVSEVEEVVDDEQNDMEENNDEQ